MGPRRAVPSRAPQIGRFTSSDSIILTGTGRTPGNPKLGLQGGGSQRSRAAGAQHFSWLRCPSLCGSVDDREKVAREVTPMSMVGRLIVRGKGETASRSVLMRCLYQGLLHCHAAEREHTAQAMGIARDHSACPRCKISDCVMGEDMCVLGVRFSL